MIITTNLLFIYSRRVKLSPTWSFSLFSFSFSDRKTPFPESRTYKITRTEKIIKVIREKKYLSIHFNLFGNYVKQRKLTNKKIKELTIILKMCGGRKVTPYLLLIFFLESVVLKNLTLV